MKFKDFLIIFTLFNVSLCHTAELRKNPKVYNALITTDENLLSSRAYPVIQPTLHEPGFQHYSPYNPYGYLRSPIVRFGRPIVPGLTYKDQIPYPVSNVYFPPKMMNRPLDIITQDFDPKDQRENAQKQKGTVTNENEVESPEDGEAQYQPKLKPPVGPQGIPPALLPYPQETYRNILPYHLPPYGYNLFPLMHDAVNGYRDHYLHPYEYIPKSTLSLRPIGNEKQDSSNSHQQNQEENQDEDNITTVQITTTSPDLDQIKNFSKSRNSDVPDVPPPPIPSGANKEIPEKS